MFTFCTSDYSPHQHRVQVADTSQNPQRRQCESALNCAKMTSNSNHLRYEAHFGLFRTFCMILHVFLRSFDRMEIKESR